MNESFRDQEQWVKFLLDNGVVVSRLEIFQNPTNHRSFRLTKFGFSCFVNRLEFTNINILLKEKISPKVLLQLEKYLEYPYFILNLKALILFDEVTAIMLQLNDGDLETYLSNLEQNS